MSNPKLPGNEGEGRGERASGRVLPYVTSVALDVRQRLLIPTGVRDNCEWLKRGHSIFAECLHDGSVQILESNPGADAGLPSDEEGQIEYRSRFHPISLDAEWRMTVPGFLRAHLFHGVPESGQLVAIFLEGGVRLMGMPVWRSLYLPRDRGGPLPKLHPADLTALAGSRSRPS